MTRPNFFIVGAPKCGTTAWYQYLKAHPDIFFPDVKEPHHFSPDRGPQDRIADRSKYLGLFAGAGQSKVVGDASPGYLESRDAAANIYAFDPKAKIAIFVRDEAEYLASRHNHLVFNGSENITDFRQAWSLSGKRDASNTPRACERFIKLDYKSAAAFNIHVEKYFAQFPADQIRVFHFRDWSRDPRSTYLEFMRFLEVEDDGRTSFERVNEAKVSHRAKFLVDFIRRPPPLARAAVKLLRKAIGRSSLGVGNLVSRVAVRPGSLTIIDDDLREEIRAFYADGRRQLEKRIWTSAKQPRT